MRSYGVPVFPGILEDDRKQAGLVGRKGRMAPRRGRILTSGRESSGDRTHRAPEHSGECCQKGSLVISASLTPGRKSFTIPVTASRMSSSDSGRVRSIQTIRCWY
jgi:hypothetical protein